MELVGTQPLELWLEDLQNVKISWSQKKTCLYPLARTAHWMAWLQRFGLLLNALLDMSRVLNSKCSKPKASKDYLN